ncbi:extracellular solute-binding protein [Paenibacillus piscarius]|uniref:extracellular solute-binding protein n=1 Tax=Paenibacillus piscarius TaxID=1089681 RepID=UPI001EE85618|nr:extracellular solute-binding protein [Paenibacillus piscarius]
MVKTAKWLSSLTALALTVGLTACGGGADNKGDAAKSGNNNPASSSNTQVVNADEPGWKSWAEPITFDWYLNYSWFADKWGVDKTTQYITKKTGVNINFIVPAGNENEKLNTMIASNNLPDFITLDWSSDSIDKMIQGGLVLPLNELAEQYDPYFFKTADPDKLKWYTEKDGNVYGYPNQSSSPSDFKKYGDNFNSVNTFLVRKDIYEAIGKPDMRTPEGFLNALKAAKEKFPEVNGQPLIPFGTQEFTDTGNGSFGTNLMDFLAIPYEQDGKLYDRSTDPEYIRWLKTFREANEQGLIAKDIFIDKRPQMEEKITQGRYFAMMFPRSDLQNQNITRYQQDPNSVYIAVDGPANSKLDQPKLSGPSIAGWTLTLISKNVKDKERAIRFLTYLISEEGNKDLFFGEKGVTYDTIDGKDQFLPQVLDMYNNDRSSFAKTYGASYTFWMMMDPALSLKWAPASVEPAKQPEDWTRGKVVDNSIYANLDPAASSPEGIELDRANTQWGKTLPKLILAGSEAEFDAAWKEFQQYRKDHDLDKIQAFQQAAFEQNAAKLGK